MRRAPLKAVLLDQRVVAGLGNIYADEALWRARLSPLRPAQSLDLDEVRRLHRALRTTLRAGIDRQGSTLRDYSAPDGAAGTMQNEFRVYGRDGEPCASVRNDDREDARRRPRNLVLSALPASLLGRVGWTRSNRRSKGVRCRTRRSTAASRSSSPRSTASREKEAAGIATEDDRGRLESIKISLDQCWDLLRQRRALREAGRDPEAADVRSAEVVERYQQ